MAAITPFLDRTRRTEGTGTPDDGCPLGVPGGPLPSIGDLLLGHGRARAGLGAFGVVHEVPALEESHAELARTVWVRRGLEDELLTGLRGGERKFWIESDCKTGELFFHLFPAMQKDILPWYLGVGDVERFAFFGSNQKMKCPTWDLPAGSPLIGGSCPGATAGQTVVEPEKRYGALGPDRRSLPVVTPGFDTRQTVNERTAICQQCVAGDTRVAVKGRGLVPIAELAHSSKPFEVWSGLGWRVARAVYNGDKPVVEVRATWGARLRATEDHKLFTLHRAAGVPYRDALTVPVRIADGLKEGDALAWQPPTVSPFAPECELARFLNAPASGERRYRTANVENFPVRWSYEVGLVLGALRGDGSVNHETAVVTLGKGARDADFVRRVGEIVNAWAGSNACLHESPVVATMAWRNRGLLEFLEDCGLDCRPPPDERHVPAKIWEASDAGVRGFLSGLFTTDGCVEVNEDRERVCISLASVSRWMVEEVQQLLFAFGIRSNLTEYRDGREEQGYFRLWKLSISNYASVRIFAGRIKFASAWKAKRLEDALSSFPERREVETFPKVESVSPLLGIEPVYDLVNVGEEHQFYANGFTAGNCYALEGNYPSPHVQVGEILRYWWSRDMLANGRVEEWVNTMVRAIGALNIPVTRQGIRPIRVHSAGDFFSPAYAAAWMEVANSVWELELEHGRREPEIRFWAPTRAWAVRGFDWPGIAATLRYPNMIVRPSSYHVDDPAPGPLVPGWAMGATSVINDHKQRGDERFDWDCGTYTIRERGGGDLAPSCADATAPDGRRGCRACWTEPHLRICYTTH